MVLRFDAADRRIENGWNEQPMFISDIQSVYGPNCMIPIRVGLYLSKHYLEQSTGGLIYSIRAKRSFERIISGVDRELSELSEGLGSQLGDDFDPRIVEGALEIVDAVPGDQCDVTNCIPVRNVVFDDFVSKLRIELNSGNIAFFQHSNLGFQQSDMMLGPFDL
jgi:hypothetical protein